jgi:type IV fimbrial biogenesis protein FimT
MTMRLFVTCQRKHAGRAGGFTLVEMLVALTVLGVLAAIAVPGFNEAFLSNRLASFSNSFIASVQLARSEAIKRNAQVKLCASADGTSCTASGGWQQGWIIFSDKGASTHADNDTIDADETRILYRETLATDYSFTGGTNNKITVEATGLVSAAATLTLCRLPPGSQERVVTVSTTGRVSVATTRNGTCT